MYLSESSIFTLLINTSNTIIAPGSGIIIPGNLYNVTFQDSTITPTFIPVALINNNSGKYKITYQISFTRAAGGGVNTITTMIYINGTKQPNFDAYISYSPGVAYSMYGTGICSLNPNSTIELRILTSSPTTITINQFNLNIVKVGF